MAEPTIDKIAIACETCPCFDATNLATGASGNCRDFDAAQVFVLPGKTGVNGQPMPFFQTIWRPVLPSDWCNRHPLFGISTSMPLDKRLAKEPEGTG